MSKIDATSPLAAQHRIGHPVDRTQLEELEASVGYDNARACASFADVRLAVIGDSDSSSLGAALARLLSGDWKTIEHFEEWTDALRSLGKKIDECIAEVPIDGVFQPSPTVVIAFNEPTEEALAEGPRTTLDVVYLTTEGVRRGQELLANGTGPYFAVEPDLWRSFEGALDDCASIAESHE